MWNSSATSRSPGGQPGDRCIHRQGRARCAGRMCGERRDAHIGGRGFADSYGYKIPVGVLGGPGRRQCPRWGLARIHPVQTWLAPLEKRLGPEYKSDSLPCLYRIQNPCYSLKNQGIILLALSLEAPPSCLTTTLYDVIAAIQDGLSPDDDALVVATVVHLLRSGRLTWKASERLGQSRRAAMWA